jgi:hypothetical protein
LAFGFAYANNAVFAPFTWVRKYNVPTGTVGGAAADWSIQYGSGPSIVAANALPTITPTPEIKDRGTMLAGAAATPFTAGQAIAIKMTAVGAYVIITCEL